MADITITEGDTLEVEYNLENTGDGTGTFDPRLIVQGVQEDQDAGITLDPGQTATGALSWPTETGDAVADALAETVTDDTSDSITVTVESTIPDSVVHRWPYSEGSGSTTVDTIGGADGAIDGATWVSNNYVDEYALESDGQDDFVTVGQLGSYGSQMDGGFTWAFTFETTDTGKFMGGQNPKMFAGFTDDWDPDNNSNRLQFTGNAQNGISTVQTNSDFNDGNKHRGVITTDSNNPSDMEIYVDTVEDAYVPRDEGNFSFGNLDGDFWLNASNTSNIFYMNVVLDDIQLADSKWTENEIQGDYNRQPWS